MGGRSLSSRQYGPINYVGQPKSGLPFLTFFPAKFLPISQPLGLGIGGT